MILKSLFEDIWYQFPLPAFNFEVEWRKGIFELNFGKLRKVCFFSIGHFSYSDINIWWYTYIHGMTVDTCISMVWWYRKDLSCCCWGCMLTKSIHATYSTFDNWYFIMLENSKRSNSLKSPNLLLKQLLVDIIFFSWSWSRRYMWIH